MIILVVVVAAGAFYGGLAYQKSKVGDRNFANFPGAGQMDGSKRLVNGQAGANFISGDILKQDTTSLTIKLKDGGSKIVLYASSTPIMKSTSGSASDLQIGQSISANGTTNSDGSLSAQSIQIRPTMPTEGASNPSPAGQ